MSLTVTAHFMENFPGENFKTRRFEAVLSTTVETDAEVAAATERLFLCARRSVESQIASASADMALHDLPQREKPKPPAYQPYQPQTQQVPFQQPQQQSFPSQSSYNTPKPASDKQLNLLNMLAKKSGMSAQELLAMPQQFFGKQTLQSLTSQEASRIIDSLNQRKAA